MVSAKERKWKDGSYGPKVTDILSVGNALGKKLREKMGFSNNARSLSPTRTLRATSSFASV